MRVDISQSEDETDCDFASAAILEARGRGGTITARTGSTYVLVRSFDEPQDVINRIHWKRAGHDLALKGRMERL